MKIILSISSGFENSIEPSYALMEISPEQAAALLELHDRTTQFLRGLEEAKLSYAVIHSTFGAHARLPHFELFHADDHFDLFNLEDPSEGRPWIVPEDITLPSYDNEDAWGCRIECHRVRVDENDVSFSALAKHGDERFTTSDILVSDLRIIAAGGTPDWPMVPAPLSEDEQV